MTVMAVYEGYNHNILRGMDTCARKAIARSTARGKNRLPRSNFFPLPSFSNQALYTGKQPGSDKTYLPLKHIQK